MQNLKEKRMANEERVLEENAHSMPPNFSYKKIEANHYLLQYIGLEGTCQEGAYIVVDLDISDYPFMAPRAVFRNNFEHLNAKPDNGQLFMYLIHPKTFHSYTSLLEIFIGINDIIHHPTFEEPYNESLVSRDGNDLGYDEKMIIQTQKFKNPKYKVL